ncbi:MAG: hypothetical protein ACLQGP_27015 [Isosphaeraceae bacterium]
MASYLDAHGYGPNGKNARKEAELAMDHQLRYFIQLTIRRDDLVNPAHVARAIEQEGGIRTRDGFGFPTVEARDAAYQQVIQQFPQRYIAAGEIMGSVASFYHS